VWKTKYKWFLSFSVGGILFIVETFNFNDWHGLIGKDVVDPDLT
jgi:hypothetical protein